MKLTTKSLKMPMEEVMEVCRLCLRNENLVWIFNKQGEITENMKDVIFISTGVQVSELSFILLRGHISYG